MDWKRRYADKLVTPAVAAALIEDGMRVGFGMTAGAAPTMEAALLARADELHDVEIGAMFPQVPSPLTTEGLEPNFKRWCIYALKPIRAEVQAQRIGMGPPLLGLFQRLGEQGRTNPHAWDVFIVRVSEPDEDGYCSFGNGVWYSEQAAKWSSHVILEVDPACPRPCGHRGVHVDDVNFLVEHDHPLARPSINVGGEQAEVADVIGAYAASLVNDGDTVQIGGGIASAGIYEHLQYKHDLGYHAEMAEEPLLDLVDGGVINGRFKTIDQGVAVAAYIRGTDRVMKSIDQNPKYAIYGCDYTNNPATIAQLDNFVAINSCIAVDLTGQITSESIGGQLYGGPGGQLEFAIGSLLSKGGRSIMCTASTTTKGASCVVGTHPPGTVVTTPRTLTDYVVTEYGVAALLGKTERQRALELIAIAHPDERERLREEADRRFGSEI